MLHLDPYIKGRDPRPWALSLRRWNEGFYREHGASAAALPIESWQMPPIADALAEAERYLRLAADARTGRERGLSLKALSEAMMWRRFITEEIPDISAAAEVARSALAELDPIRDSVAVSSIHAMLDEREGGAPELVPIAPHLQVDLLISQALAASDAQAPAAFASLLGARALFAEHATVSQRKDRLDVLAALLTRAHAPGEDLSAWGDDWPRQAKALERHARDGTKSPRVIVACALDLALLSREGDHEEDGLALVQLAVRSDPAFTTEIADVVSFVLTVVALGAGANAANSGSWARALMHYGIAIGAALKLQIADDAAEILARIAEVVSVAPLALAENVLLLLGGIWLECERQLAEAGSLSLLELAVTLYCKLHGEAAARVGHSWLLTQLAKGLRFRTALANPRRDRARGENEQVLLDQIAELEREVARGGGAGSEIALDDEILQVSYLRASGATRGSSPAARLRNLQYRFELDQIEQQNPSTTEGNVIVLSIPEVQALLDPDTVLLNYFLGQMPDGRLAVYVLSVTREGLAPGRIEHEVPWSPILIPVDGHELVQSPLATITANHRAWIRAEPGFETISDEGREAMATWPQGLLGGHRAYLDAERQSGKRHLCIVPHGPLQFYPFHLLGADRPLAEDWIVTYLPNLALLRPRPAPPGDGLLAVAVGGYDDNDPLKDATAEAEEIAQLFGATPLIDAAATPAAVLNRMAGHRYLHFAAHGRQNALAPAFHCMNLAPDDGGERRLFAHDVERLDLSGVDIVSIRCRVPPEATPAGTARLCGRQTCRRAARGGRRSSGSAPGTPRPRHPL